jgi:hypothetical protein
MQAAAKHHACEATPVRGRHVDIIQQISSIQAVACAGKNVRLSALSDKRMLHVAQSNGRFADTG